MSLPLCFGELNVIDSLIYSPPVLIDVVFEVKYVLLELAEHHKRPILCECRTGQHSTVIINRITFVS